MLSIQQKFRFEILEIPLTQWNESTESKGTVPYTETSEILGWMKSAQYVSVCMYEFEEVK